MKPKASYSPNFSSADFVGGWQGQPDTMGWGAQLLAKAATGG
jgi:hypothetical protein